LPRYSPEGDPSCVTNPTLSTVYGAWHGVESHHYGMSRPARLVCLAFFALHADETFTFNPVVTHRVSHAKSYRRSHDNVSQPRFAMHRIPVTML
jgi:hypothetical protein